MDLLTVWLGVIAIFLASFWTSWMSWESTDNTIMVWRKPTGAESGSWPSMEVSLRSTAKREPHGKVASVFLRQVVRWPGVMTRYYNEMISHEDWLPTFLHAGVPDVEKLKTEYQANGKNWKMHMDGNDFLPFFKGEVEKSPRRNHFLLWTRW
jgi:arylsulfatase